MYSKVLRCALVFRYTSMDLANEVAVSTASVYSYIKESKLCGDDLPQEDNLI